jgi:phage/plasmid primase-like uncharacterized protein
MVTIDSPEEANRKVPLLEIFKHYDIDGLKLHGSRLTNGNCPFCGARQLFAFPTNGTWSCTSCKRFGSTFDLIVSIEKVSEVEALKLLNRWICGESQLGFAVCQ